MGDTNEPSFTAKYAKYANKVPIFFRLRIGFPISDLGFRFSSCRVEAALAKTDRISDFGFRILAWSSSSVPISHRVSRRTHRKGFPENPSKPALLKKCKS